MKKLIISLMAVTTCLTANAFAFKDVPKNAFYEKSVNYLQEQDIVNGYKNGTVFKPSQNITRAEFLKLTIESMNFQEYYFLVSEGGGGAMLDYNYSDVQESDWFSYYVQLAATFNIIKHPACSSYENDCYETIAFRPNDPITFAEASKIMSNAFSVNPLSDGSAKLGWYAPYIKNMQSKVNLSPVNTDPQHLISRGETAYLIYEMLMNSDDITYTTYKEDEFGFSLQSPDFLYQDEGNLHEKTGKILSFIPGAYDENIPESKIEVAVQVYGSSSVENAMKNAESGFDEVTHRKVREDRYVLSGYKNDGKTIIYQIGYIGKTFIQVLELQYPKYAEEYYDGIVEHVVGSFVPGNLD